MPSVELSVVAVSCPALSVGALGAGLVPLPVRVVLAFCPLPPAGLGSKKVDFGGGGSDPPVALLEAVLRAVFEGVDISSICFDTKPTVVVRYACEWTPLCSTRCARVSDGGRWVF